MLGEPRTYRNSAIRLVLLIVLLLLLGIAPFVILGGDTFPYQLIVFAFLIPVMLISIYSLTRSTTISNESISTRSLLGERTLNWTEIDSVSGGGNAIKLHNRDGDVTIAPSPHLPGYTEVIELIGAKRPDLFSPSKYSEMSRNWLSSLLFLALGAVFLGVGVYLYFTSDDTMMPILFLAFFGFILILSIFTSILALQFDGTTLTMRYLLSKTELQPSDIFSIGLSVTQTRSGKSYSIIMHTIDKRMFRFSGMAPGLPITYLVLKNWRAGQAR